MYNTVFVIKEELAKIYSQISDAPMATMEHLTVDVHICFSPYYQPLILAIKISSLISLYCNTCNIFSLKSIWNAFLQISVAAILTVVYAIVQMIVLVGIIIQIANEPCSPNALFFYFVTATFILAGLLHPKVDTARCL